MKNIFVLIYYGAYFFEIILFIRFAIELVSRATHITGFFGIIYRNICKLTDFIVNFTRQSIPVRIGRMDFTYIMILLSMEIIKNGIRLLGRL